MFKAQGKIALLASFSLFLVFLPISSAFSLSSSNLLPGLRQGPSKCSVFPRMQRVRSRFVLKSQLGAGIPGVGGGIPGMGGVPEEEDPAAEAKRALSQKLWRAAETGEEADVYRPA